MDGQPVKARSAAESRPQEQSLRDTVETHAGLGEMLTAAERERDDYIRQAERAIAFLEGRVAMLKELIEQQQRRETLPSTDGRDA